jgi:6-phosphogluconolactonase
MDAAELSGRDEAPAELVVARDAEALAALAADRLAHALRAAAERHTGSVTVALAGGRTPRRCYELLARDAGVPWSRLRVWPGDERAVAPDSPESNVRLLRETLVVPGALPANALDAPFETAPRTEAELEAAAAAFARRLPERLDLVLLGLGADGHVASLFPGSPALDERRRCVAVRGPVEPRARISLTPPMIATTGTLLVLASGSEKAAAVARALEGELDLRACPAQLARGGAWLLDVDAAGRLARVRGSRRGGSAHPR